MELTTANPKDKKKGYSIMFEITYNGEEMLRQFKERRIAYKEGEYDFTFESRYIIYHCNLCNDLVYLAIDLETSKGVEIQRRFGKQPYKKEQYYGMIPQILKAIKYTGDSRHISVAGSDPYATIDTIFGVILPRKGYKYRPEQARLSKRMYTALVEKKAGICEAEVGSGKTLAYLVAALIAREQEIKHRRKDDPITITTSSIELQKNILEKEIPMISDILTESYIIEVPVVAVLRKGKEHYMCPKRYQEYTNSNNKPLAFNGVDIDKLVDLDTLAIEGSIKEQICVKDNCHLCKYRTMCEYRKHIDFCMSGQIDIQVTNHNLYFASMNNDYDILQKSTAVIVDEAHKIKDAAVDIFGTRISLFEIENFVALIKRVCKKSFVEEMNASLDRLEKYSQKLFNSMSKYAVSYDDIEERNKLIELSDEEKHALLALTELLLEFESVKSDIPKEYRGVCLNLIRKLEVFLDSSSNDVWIEKDEKTITMCSASKHIGRELFKTVWDRGVTHIVTSGTISDGRTFRYFKHEVGLDYFKSSEIVESRVSSPFDMEKNTRLYIPNDIPPVEEKKYYDAVAKRIVELIKTTNGHTAILFTSYTAMQTVYQKTQNSLRKYKVFVMTKGDKQVIQRFKHSKNGVLFATGAMWEGVNCVGDVLSSVIIPRLPFPMRSAVLEGKKESCTNSLEFINRYAVPEMIIKLRQGAGRLVRSETDTGIISILDSRANKFYYADIVRDALEKHPVITTLSEVHKFMHEIKDDAFFVNDSSQKRCK